MDEIEYLKSCVKSINDFPKNGIVFRDITSVCENPDAFSRLCRAMADMYRDAGITKVVGSESRGFVFGAPVAVLLGCGFVMARKPGKLPRDVYSEDYELEYGTNTLEIHKDAISSSDRVLIVDDLIATGGTVGAQIKLIRRFNAEIAGAVFAISLPDLGGTALLKEKYGVDSRAVMEFPGH